MVKKKILIIGEPLDEGVAELKAHFDVIQAPLDAPYDWALSHMAEFDGLLTVSSKVDKALIDAGTKLKMIATHSVGFDHIDVAYARERGILVTNAPEAVCFPTAELTLGLMIDTLRQVTYFDKSLRKGAWHSQARSHLKTGLNGKVLGIFGLGRIGKEVARLAQAFGMTVIYYKRQRLSEAEEQALHLTYRTFEDLVAESDVLSLHAPATPETNQLFSAAIFKKMKKTAILINTARGALVNQADLAQALAEGEIAGLGADVFVDEPRVPVELLAFEQVVLTPHIGTATLEARIATGQEASQNLITYFETGQILNQV